MSQTSIILVAAVFGVALMIILTVLYLFRKRNGNEPKHW